MPAPRKIFLNGFNYFVSFRMEEGLPLIPNKLITALIWSAIARSYKKYKQRIIAVKVQGNHIHMVIQCISPQTFPLFIGFIKQESAHYINRLLNRRQKSVWADRYDSPVVLTHESLIEKLGYMFTNSVKDGLVGSVAEDPFPSTLNLLEVKNPTLLCFLFPRTSITPLKDPHKIFLEEEDYYGNLLSSDPQTYELPIEPLGFKDAYPEISNCEDEQIVQMIIKSVKNQEQVAIDERKGVFVGVKNLLRQSMLKPHTPRTFSKRTICISSDIPKRIEFLSWVNSLKSDAKRVYLKWKQMDFSEPFPIGLFPPCTPQTGSFIHAAHSF